MGFDQRGLVLHALCTHLVQDAACSACGCTASSVPPQSRCEILTRNRLVTSMTGALAESYGINGLGQRVFNDHLSAQARK
jgi:hypothetical protein